MINPRRMKIWRGFFLQNNQNLLTFAMLSLSINTTH
jgi:hypothetical protein